MAPPFPSATKAWHTSSYPSINPGLPALSLAGKTVVVTGGGSGIGLSISRSAALAKATNLFILGRRSAVLSSATKEILALNTGTNVYPIIADIANKAQVDKAFAEIHGKFGGKLDLLITNAGYFTGLRAYGTETVDEWQTAFDINVKGFYLVTSAFIPLAKTDATIISISTAIAHLPASSFPGFSSYAATKLAGAKLLEYVQGQYPELHVVNLHPGQVTETEMAGKAKGNPRLERHIDDCELRIWRAWETC